MTDPLAVSVLCQPIGQAFAGLGAFHGVLVVHLGTEVAAAPHGHDHARLAGLGRFERGARGPAWNALITSPQSCPQVVGN